jgi:uncharacterized membrane protein YfcA
VPVVLFVVGVMGGALNAVAGGGSFLALPALLYAGVTPVAANATCTLAMWPASVVSGVAYRRDITMDAGRWLTLGVVSIAGALAGALLLIRTSDTSFLRLLPWLMLLAAATFTFGSPVRLGTRRQNIVVVVMMQFLISIYGGYFGGGMGIMMLATLAIAGMTDIHEMNGLKSVLASAINAVALATFIIERAVVWRPGLIMMVGGMAGGSFAAAFARKVHPKRVRLFVVVIGWAMTVYFFLRPDAP